MNDELHIDIPCSDPDLWPSDDDREWDDLEEWAESLLEELR